ncbi:lactonase family protein [Pseudomonas sp. S75]|uniref:lactonase family protein n=1 Tax=unclassified Pseudomonas TaxID=196821 RepID=UPI001908539C|nr:MULTISPECIES: lactonase family protein [unclassified Pseudomonas]MBJ9977727.1 lactonase family protein [Pseudomonas sp. S30]MBK0155294.1 lactonase family protein [Pseudomonas sp. S75]
MNRTFKRLLIVSLMGLGASAQAATLLVGTYTDGASKGLYRYAFDTSTGQIDKRPLQVIETDSPSWLVLSEDNKQLYTVNETAKGHVSSYAVGSDGTLKLLGQVASLGDEPTHASLSQDERYLFVANYAVAPDSGGSLVVVAVDRDGKLGKVRQQLSHTPSRVDAERQRGGHVHSVVRSPDGSHLYASDLGADKVFIYRYDGASSDQPLTPATPASISLPPGSGPRHLLFDAKGRHAYLTLEMSAEVVMFDVDQVRLIERQRLPLTDKREPSAKAAAGLHLSADGRFLYVSNRGTANQIVVYAVNAEDGRLSLVQRRSVEGDHPREFALDPSGKFLLVANQKTNQIVVMQRDPRTGTLGKTVQTLAQQAPADLKLFE